MTSRVQTIALQQDTPAAPHLANVVQRSCACGGATGMMDSCESCNAKELAGTPVVQPRLTIGPVDDPHEREADRVADHVMRMQDTEEDEEKVQRQVEDKEEEQSIQAKREGGPTGEISANQTAEIDSIKTGGEPLRPASRDFFEQRFGHDFSRVRIHSDDRAAQSAKGIHAQAYTTGQHIVFGSGHYSPDTQAGQRLLAHELTHVIQQDGGAPGRVQRKATWVPGKPTPNVNPAQQVAENKIKNERLYLGQTNFRLNGQSFTDAKPDDMNKSLKTPNIAYGQITLGGSNPGSGSGAGSAAGSGSGSEAGSGSSAGSGSGPGSGAQPTPKTAFECRFDSVPDNVGTNEVNVLNPGTWKHVTDKKNVGGRFPFLKACTNGFGDVTFVLKGKPDDDTVRDTVKAHENEHAKDNEKIFNDLIVDWDKEITTAKQAKSNIKAMTQESCARLLYVQFTKSKSPQSLITDVAQRIKTKGDDFHKDPAGKKPVLTPEKPDSDCNVVKARVEY